MTRTIFQLVSVLILINVCSSKRLFDVEVNTTNNDGDEWAGRWFPGLPFSQRASKISPSKSPLSVDMWSSISVRCDDGKTNLTVDWDGSPLNYTCIHPKQRFPIHLDTPSLIIKDNIPSTYRALHACMDREIEYDTLIPTFGTHRPAWPKYGEYKFVPRQRWLHSLEHGAIVMLYHPCAHPLLVKQLKRLVKNCLYRHVITPYTLLPPERPLALLAWGWTLLMAEVDPHLVQNFITQHALQAYEKTYKDGVYDHLLVEHSEIVTDAEDSKLCPMQHIMSN